MAYLCTSKKSFNPKTYNVMKRFSTFWTLALMAVLTLSFTSCDDDAYVADTLAGTWKGNMYVSRGYDGRTYDATYSEVYFNQDPYTYSSGTGYWVDHYAGDAPWQNVANHINWTVRNRIIYVTFLEDRYTVQIGNYRLSNGYFEGTIYDNGQTVDFSLVHTSSPNWGSYTYGGYDYYDGYGYAKRNDNFTRGTGDSTQVKAPVRIFRTK